MPYYTTNPYTHYKPNYIETVKPPSYGYDNAGYDNSYGGYRSENGTDEVDRAEGEEGERHALPGHLAAQHAHNHVHGEPHTHHGHYHGPHNHYHHHGHGHGHYGHGHHHHGHGHGHYGHGHHHHGHYQHAHDHPHHHYGYGHIHYHHESPHKGGYGAKYSQHTAIFTGFAIVLMAMWPVTTV